MLPIFQHWNIICRGKTVSSHLTRYILYALQAVLYVAFGGKQRNRTYDFRRQSLQNVKKLNNDARDVMNENMIKCQQTNIGYR